MRIRSYLEQFLANDQGAELAEYAVGVALLVAITIVVFQVLGDAIVDENTGTGARIEAATWSPPSP